MNDSVIDMVLRKVGRGCSTYADEMLLRRYICELRQQLADAQDAARRAAIEELCKGQEEGA